MEISKFDLAAIKRVNKNSSALYKKLEKLRKEISDLTEKHNVMLNEINDIEAYVTKKWGFYSWEILDGTADRKLAERAAAADAECVISGFPCEEDASI